MHALQDLGERLGDLKPEQLRQFDLPEALVIAINDYRRFTKWEAKRRQMQYIGRLMRDIDPAPIAAKLGLWNQTSREAVAGFHAAETWRDKLLASDDALNTLVAQHPEADRQRIAQLTERARTERAAGKPPANARLLFRELSRLLTAERPHEGANE